LLKIRHKQTKVIEEISWHQWEHSTKYSNNKSLWKIIDYGEPVDVYEFTDNGKRKKLYTLDKDHAIRMIKGNPDKYYFKKARLNKSIPSFFVNIRNSYLIALESIEEHPIIRTLGIVAIILTIVSFIIWL